MSGTLMPSVQMQDDCWMLEIPAFWTTFFVDRLNWLCFYAISFGKLHAKQIKVLNH